jgi:hypothetical protein
VRKRTKQREATSSAKSSEAHRYLVEQMRKGLLVGKGKIIDGVTKRSTELQGKD